MSHPLLLALFSNQSVAAEAARQLHALGIPREDLSVVAMNHQMEGAIANEVGGSPGSEIEDSRRAGQSGDLESADAGRDVSKWTSWDQGE